MYLYIFERFEGLKFSIVSGNIDYLVKMELLKVILLIRF